MYESGTFASSKIYESGIIGIVGHDTIKVIRFAPKPRPAELEEAIIYCELIARIPNFDELPYELRQKAIKFFADNVNLVANGTEPDQVMSSAKQAVSEAVREAPQEHKSLFARVMDRVISMLMDFANYVKRGLGLGEAAQKASDEIKPPTQGLTRR